MNPWCRRRCVLRPLMPSRRRERHALTLIVVGHRSGAALLHGKPGWVPWSAWICSFHQSRDDGMGERIDLETYAIAQLIDGAGSVVNLTCFIQCRWRSCAPDALDGTRTDANDLRHHVRSPASRLAGRGSRPGQRHEVFCEATPAADAKSVSVGRPS